MTQPPDNPQTWSSRPLAPTDVSVGPCAWRVTVLAGEHASYVAAHPSLVVVDAADPDDLLRAAAPRLAGLPVMLHVVEPAFARRLPELLRGRIAALGRTGVEIVTLWVEEVSDLKGGVMLQMLRQLRDEGLLRHIGLGHADVRNAEWLAMHTPARVLVFPFSLAAQSARYRTIDKAREYGMVCVAADLPAGEDAIRFALGTRDLVLPVLDRPIPPGLRPMGPEEVDAAWQEFRAVTPPPPPLPRGQPPE